MGKGQSGPHSCVRAGEPGSGQQRDYKYFGSILFIEVVQRCECEINVLNSLWVPGCHAFGEAPQPRCEEGRTGLHKGSREVRPCLPHLALRPAPRGAPAGGCAPSAPLEGAAKLGFDREQAFSGAGKRPRPGSQLPGRCWDCARAWRPGVSEVGQDSEKHPWTSLLELFSYGVEKPTLSEHL